jgi:hypothetical protein
LLPEKALLSIFWGGNVPVAAESGAFLFNRTRIERIERIEQDLHGSGSLCSRYFDVLRTILWVHGQQDVTRPKTVANEVS